MKICVISFDFWHYDEYIVQRLLDKNIDAHHINVGAFSHKNFQEKAINTVNKVFLGKNPKHQKRQKFVKNSIEKLGFQDQILILNPDTLDIQTIAYIKKFTNRLITYLYDSLERYPVQEKLAFFDAVFSFDDNDIKKYGFKKITNYNYLPHLETEKDTPKFDLFYITSYDKGRNKIIRPLLLKLVELGTVFQIIVIGKKVWKLKLKYIFSQHVANFEVIFRSKPIPHKKIIENQYRNTKAILDLTRCGQCGLSFRVFEAMAMEKKIVTNNYDIKNYDFYNPNNILVLNENLSNLDKSFFETPYQKLPSEVYEKYTLDNWVKTVFGL